MVDIDKGARDVVCIYCPDTKACYYFDPEVIDLHVNLRIEPPRNNQQRAIRWAKDFTKIPTHLRGVRART